MSLQFSRSLRSMNLDSFRPARIAMILALLLLFVLILWFFFAKITLYASSTDLKLGQDGMLVASFPAETMPRLKPGQAALLRLSGGPEQPAETIAVWVFEKGGENQVILVPAGAIPPPELLGEKPVGQVDVEVEYVTPVDLVLRASGRFLNKSRLPLSPQATPASGQQ